VTSLSKKGSADRSEFIFVGDHPAIDFANTLAMSQGQWTDHLRVWADVVDWLSLAGLSSAPALQIPTSRNAEAVKTLLDLRRAWKAELDKLVADGKVSDDFIKRLNRLLADDVFHETLHRRGKLGFHLDRSASHLRGEKLALALLVRQIAHFLTQANFHYLHRCANTASCVLYFYDTTKNHRRQWCSTALCGNRHKVAEFRKRQAASKNLFEDAKAGGPSDLSTNRGRPRPYLGG
jgi:predicted RNA-binding Zn ribbon-like protein